MKNLLFPKDGMDPDDFMKKWDVLCDRWNSEIAEKVTDPMILRAPGTREALFLAAKEIKEEMLALQKSEIEASERFPAIKKVLCAHRFCINFISQDRLKKKARYCCDRCYKESKKRFLTYEQTEKYQRKYYASLK